VPKNEAQETLDRILGDLNSDDPTIQLAALNELERVEYSSPAIMKRLEELAVNAQGEAQRLALSALGLQTNQLVSARRTAIPRDDRILILREVTRWETDGLIDSQRVEVIRRRYDFDIRKGIAAKPRIQPIAETQPKVEALEPAAPLAPQPESPQPIPAERRPAEPRASLTQVLLSETSVRIYLYLGAFFVIAAAAILAALVEAARLPVLLVATMAFAVGAVGFKKRLPQPSFAFAIVFSFLLPIDASVIADLLNLPPRPNDLYWSVIFIVMSGIWAFGTWFYQSRMFSLASFAGFTLGASRLVAAFDLSADWYASAMGISALISLLGVYLLKRWKEQNFAMPLFLAAQAVQGVSLLLSGIAIFANLFDSNLTPDAWISNTLTWLAAASFFAASDLIIPFLLFPWASAASLFLIPWLTLSIFDMPSPVKIIGFSAWGALIAIGSDIARRLKNISIQQYQYPLLALSLPLFSIATLWGLIEGVEYAFATFLITGVMYTLVHASQPRWYVWTAALLAWLGTFFSFFALPFMQTVDVYIGYQFLLASMLLLLPELFSKAPLTLSRSSNWPPIALGVMVVGFNSLIAHAYLIEGKLYFGHAAVILGVYAFLFAAYALRFKLPMLGYFATTAFALTVLYALVFFELDLWLPSLTALSAIYYFAGFLLARKEQSNAWGMMLIYSGLALGMIVSLIALPMLEPFGGWYTILISALFLIEMFTRRNGILEIFALSLLNSALIIILNDLKVRELVYYVYGSSFIWLGGDALLHLTYKGRSLRPATIMISALTTLTAVTMIVLDFRLASSSAATCFAVYAAFFAAYAWICKLPALGYLSTASAAVTMFYALDTFNIETWLPIFTGLAVAYYVAGFLLRKRSAGWAEMLRYSGLGLGSLLSLIALFRVEPTGGWYAGIVGLLFVVETASTRNGWFEAGVYIPFSIASFLILRDLKIDEFSYTLLALSLVWLLGDAVFTTTFNDRKVARFVQFMGGGIALLNAFVLLIVPASEAALCFGVYAVFFAAYALLYKKPLIGYVSTASLALAVYFGIDALKLTWWLFPVVGIGVAYYVAGSVLRNAKVAGWDSLMLFSGLGLGIIVALSSPLQFGGAENALPIAIAATLFAAEAFAKRNVWLAFPANIFYLISYFTLLIKLNVDAPQYFSIGAALLGMLMHYLLVRAQSKAGAFVMGMASQLVLLGTTYIQMYSTEQLGFFFVLFVQSLAILLYGIVMRSRSLVIAPISFAVLGTLTVVYSALKDLSLVVIIGVTGIVLLVLGILAVLMRERITLLAERFSEWNA